MEGVSIIVCCHNSANRIPLVLHHLQGQCVPLGLMWEIVLIDNASTDHTQRVATECWPRNPPAPLRVVSESKLGLNHARNTGLAESRYSIVSFIDDDNWVCPDYVRTVWTVMSDHPEVGACGGYNEPVFEEVPPDWFEKSKGSYAVGCQATQAGDVTDSRGFLWGAGLSLRRKAWRQLVCQGFRFSLFDRCGNNLTAGGDAEICCALRLGGWRLWYEPNLKLRHYIPAGRLKWGYLRRLHRGFGATSVGLAPYFCALENKPPTFLVSLIKTKWCIQSLLSLFKLVKYSPIAIRSVVFHMEGNDAILSFESQLGKFQELMKRRRSFEKSNC